MSKPDRRTVLRGAGVTLLGAGWGMAQRQPDCNCARGSDGTPLDTGVSEIRPAIERFYFSTFTIEAPGTVDGGDICEAGDHFFIGLSHRTNEEGARQLTACLNAVGYTVSIVDIRSIQTILHLKSAISYIGDNTIIVMEEMAANPQFSRFDLLRVSAGESYAANCVRVNDRVLIAEGYPRLCNDLVIRSFAPLVLNMSEFQKMDGGLSCLSLRF